VLEAWFAHPLVDVFLTDPLDAWLDTHLERSLQLLAELLPQN
jgi:hypothetical protein